MLNFNDPKNEVPGQEKFGNECGPDGMRDKAGDPLQCEHRKRRPTQPRARRGRRHSQFIATLKTFIWFSVSICRVAV